MGLKGTLGLGVWLLAAAALGGQPVGKDAPSGKESAPTPSKPAYVVVVQDKIPVQFGDTQIGELAEGTRLAVLQEKDGWSRVRVALGASWFEGWVRTAMTALDSMAEVPHKLAPTAPSYVYTDPVSGAKLYPGPALQFIEVRVKFDPTEKSPARVYFSWADEANADLCLRYLDDGKLGRAVPHGYIRRVPGMTRPVFETREKRQTLILKPGEPLVETYVFAVPIRARDFDLVLKDVTTRVPIKR